MSKQPQYKNIPEDHKEIQKEIINFFDILNAKQIQKILKLMIDLEANPEWTNED